MAKKITRLPSPILPEQKVKRVCGYGRVSSGKDAMLHSLSAQVSYFSNLIQSTPGWEYAGVYADEAFTGTKNNRPEFQKMLADCRAGIIDMIITKSISRFARNTLTLLETAREMKSLGIDIYFEEQELHTLSGEGELLLTLLAAHAQAESESVSSNCKWRIRNDFKKGVPVSSYLYGYQMKNRQFFVVPEEAKIVKRIFDLYLSGLGKNKISRVLNGDGVPAYGGGQWCPTGIEHILRNEKYKGDLLLQKVYRADHLSKKKVLNCGQLPRYIVNDNHEAIIDSQTFDAVQQEIARRAECNKAATVHRYPFSGIIVCGKCGKHYQRKINGAGANSKYAHPVWICATYNSKGKNYCDAKQLPEDILLRAACEVLSKERITEDDIKSAIESITVESDTEIRFQLFDGTVVKKTWKYSSRSESWTAEMKAACGEQTRRRMQLGKNSNLYSGDKTKVS